MNVIQEFVDKTSLLFIKAKGCQIGDATLQIPHGASIAKYFKDAVTEDQQARTGRYPAR
jgi:hypothetical protein